MTKIALVSTSANQQVVVILNIVYILLFNIVCVWVFKSTAILFSTQNAHLNKFMNKNIIVLNTNEQKSFLKYKQYKQAN